MSFNKAVRTSTRFHFTTAPRFTVRETPTGFTGVLKLPPDVMKELGWATNDFIDILVGDGDDAGWVGLVKSTESNHRAKVKIQANGVGSYSSKVLVPEGIASKVATRTPESRIGGEAEQKMFFFKPAA